MDIPNFQMGFSSHTMSSKRISWPTQRAQALHEGQQQSLKCKTNDTTITSQKKKTRVDGSSMNHISQQATPDSNSASGNMDTTPWLTDHKGIIDTVSRPPMDCESPDNSKVDKNEGKAETSEAELGRGTELSHLISEFTSFQSA